MKHPQRNHIAGIYLILLSTLILLTQVTLAVAQASTTPQTTSGIDKAWKLDLSGFSFDPTSWNDAMRLRMYIVGAGVGYAFSVGMSMPLAVAFGVFLFGLVKLNWLLLGSASLALYGWKGNKKVFLAAGLALTYAMSFGLTL